MRLENAKGEYLQLKILDYEFPKITDDRWDSNWLEIGIDVKHDKHGTWTTSAPCLLTFEVERLIRWLGDLGEDYTQAESKLEFLEPNLVFDLLTDKEYPIIRVFFELEVRPEWTPGLIINFPKEDLWCDFPILENDLGEVIKSLRLQLGKHPERAKQSLTDNKSSPSLPK